MGLLILDNADISFIVNSSNFYSYLNLQEFTIFIATKTLSRKSNPL